MQHVFTLALLATLFGEKNEREFGLSGNQFFALSVSNADSVSAWYENAFQLKLLKTVKSPDGSVNVRIIGNKNLMIEIVQPPGSKSLNDCGIDPSQAYRMKGIFKIGLYVEDIEAAKTYLTKKNVFIKHSVFEDTDTRTRSFIVTDNKGNLIQIIQHPGRY
jgi:hypothetical protein